MIDNETKRIAKAYRRAMDDPIRVIIYEHIKLMGDTATMESISNVAGIEREDAEQQVKILELAGIVQNFLVLDETGTPMSGYELTSLPARMGDAGGTRDENDGGK
jgi:hypothetical protein